MRIILIQLWAKLNTPENSIFIIPPHLEGFRIESERSIYVSWKDGTVAFFDEDLGSIWLKRLQMLGFQPTRGEDTLDYVSFDEVEKILDPIYRNLDSELIFDIAKNLDTCFVYFVTFEDTNFIEEFQIYYKNQKYIIYYIDNQKNECESD